MRALQIAAAGMAAQQTRVEVISNNLANMNTTGYNARKAEFADLHYQQVARPGSINASDGTVLPTGIQLGLGVRPTAVSMILSQGTSAQTGGDLDVAIEGRGYLEVTLPNGTAAYSRDGGKMPNRSRSTRRARSTPLSLIALNRSCSGKLPWRGSQTPKVWRPSGPICSSKQQHPGHRS